MRIYLLVLGHPYVLTGGLIFRFVFSIFHLSSETGQQTKTKIGGKTKLPGRN